MYPVFVCFDNLNLHFYDSFFQIINDAMITTVLTYVSDTNVCLPAPTHVLATPTPTLGSDLIRHFSFWSEIRRLFMSISPDGMLLYPEF